MIENDIRTCQSVRFANYNLEMQLSNKNEDTDLYIIQKNILNYTLKFLTQPLSTFVRFTLQKDYITSISDLDVLASEADLRLFVYDRYIKFTLSTST